MRLVLLACVLASCQPSYGGLPVYGTGGHDVVVYPLQPVIDARTQAHQRPGPAPAVAYARALHVAYGNRSYGTDTQSFQRDVADAVSVLDAAVPNAGPDASTVLAWEGVILNDAGRGDASLRTLLESMKLGPNLVAAVVLVPAYGGLGRRKEVGDVCNATVPVLVNVDDQYDLIEMCNKNMGALSEESALSWARPEIATWYRQEHARRAEVAAADAERQREREEAAEERRAAQQRYENRVVRQTEICASECKQTGLSCENRCYGDEDCEQRCVDSNHACVDACSSRAYMQLGQ